MKKTKILLIVIIPILFLNACNTLKDGFRSQKKDSIDEFLVEKKSPLIMPPDFDELPLPDDQNQNQNLENNEEVDIKSLISNNDETTKENQNNSNQNTNFENSLLEKIKKN